MNDMERIVCILIGYAFGLFQSGYLLGKLHGIDIRKEGSGNSGTTNALRVMGVKAGLLVFAGDVIKLFAAAFVTHLIFSPGRWHEPYSMILILYTAIGAVLGHNYPFYLSFKGGKGIAVTAAVRRSADHPSLPGGFCGRSPDHRVCFPRFIAGSHTVRDPLGNTWNNGESSAFRDTVFYREHGHHSFLGGTCILEAQIQYPETRCRHGK